MSVKSLLKLIVLSLVFTGIFQFTHESGHVVVAFMSGEQPTWSFSSVVQMWDDIPQDPDTWTPITLPEGSSGWVKYTPPAIPYRDAIFSLMGPIFSFATLAVMLFFYFRLTSERHRTILLTGIFLLSFTLMFYYLRAGAGNWNDEKDVAYRLGISAYVLIIPFGISYFLAFIFACVQLYRRNFRFLHYPVMMISTIAGGITMNRAQGIIFQEVDKGNVWFNPVMGYSLPVFVTFLLCILVFIAIWRDSGYVLSRDGEQIAPANPELIPAEL